ncbi:hypothetical protein LOZ52_000153 [Ophidiomyces ophidiicola]|nr:hypothetical protein LOY89_000918 [Ophidiomyces ophidiicola]KAI2412413.1 hypothetical protein LOY90_001933 [Ophidiomyces ophidiicola]KAI2432856.1 hypothetical protein LOZ52_000153 [Ophidiomyces ophidiicola]KAI2462662.1 hypothetical protein LOY97_000084 [Ophidiomyces ophidiicola]
MQAIHYRINSYFELNGNTSLKPVIAAGLLLIPFVLQCDGNQPCYRCAAYNHPCLFRERKVTQTKAYSRGFVEMLESHHALVVKALQQLYAHCINNKCFPGEPIDVVDGYPLTHAILDRLGLIKEAEESTSEGLDTDTIETSQYWRPQRRSSSSIDTEYASSMQTSPVERSPISDSTSESPTSESHRGPPLTSLQGIYSSYGPYHCPDEQAWPMDATTQVMDFTHPTATTGIQVETQYLPAPTSAVGPTSTICHENSTSHLAIGNTTGPTSPACGHTGYTGPFPSISSFAYQHSGDGTQGADQQYEWAPNLWDRSKSGQPPNVK